MRGRIIALLFVISLVSLSFADPKTDVAYLSSDSFYVYSKYRDSFVRPFTIYYDYHGSYRMYTDYLDDYRTFFDPTTVTSSFYFPDHDISIDFINASLSFRVYYSGDVLTGSFTVPNIHKRYLVRGVPAVFVAGFRGVFFDTVSEVWVKTDYSLNIDTNVVRAKRYFSQSSGTLYPLSADKSHYCSLQITNTNKWYAFVDQIDEPGETFEKAIIIYFPEYSGEGGAICYDSDSDRTLLRFYIGTDSDGTPDFRVNVQKLYTLGYSAAYYDIKGLNHIVAYFEKDKITYNDIVNFIKKYLDPTYRNLIAEDHYCYLYEVTGTTLHINCMVTQQPQVRELFNKTITLDISSEGYKYMRLKTGQLGCYTYSCYNYQRFCVGTNIKEVYGDYDIIKSPYGDEYCIAKNTWFEVPSYYKVVKANISSRFSDYLYEGYKITVYPSGQEEFPIYIAGVNYTGQDLAILNDNPTEIWYNYPYMDPEFQPFYALTISNTPIYTKAYTPTLWRYDLLYPDNQTMFVNYVSERTMYFDWELAQYNLSSMPRYLLGVTEVCVYGKSDDNSTITIKFPYSNLTELSVDLDRTLVYGLPSNSTMIYLEGRLNQTKGLLCNRSYTIPGTQYYNRMLDFSIKGEVGKSADIDMIFFSIPRLDKLPNLHNESDYYTLTNYTYYIWFEGTNTSKITSSYWTLPTASNNSLGADVLSTQRIEIQNLLGSTITISREIMLPFNSTNITIYRGSDLFYNYTKQGNSLVIVDNISSNSKNTYYITIDWGQLKYSVQQQESYIIPGVLWEKVIQVRNPTYVKVENILVKTSIPEGTLTDYDFAIYDYDTGENLLASGEYRVLFYDTDYDGYDDTLEFYIPLVDKQDTKTYVIQGYLKSPIECNVTDTCSTEADRIHCTKEYICRNQYNKDATLNRRIKLPPGATNIRVNGEEIPYSIDQYGNKWVILSDTLNPFSSRYYNIEYDVYGIGIEKETKLEETQYVNNPVHVIITLTIRNRAGIDITDYLLSLPIISGKNLKIKDEYGNTIYEASTVSGDVRFTINIRSGETKILKAMYEVESAVSEVLNPYRESVNDTQYIVTPVKITSKAPLTLTNLHYLFKTDLGCDEIDYVYLTDDLSKKGEVVDFECMDDKTADIEIGTLDVGETVYLKIYVFEKRYATFSVLSNILRGFIEAVRNLFIKLLSIFKVGI